MKRERECKRERQSKEKDKEGALRETGSAMAARPDFTKPPVDRTSL